MSRSWPSCLAPLLALLPVLAYSSSARAFEDKIAVGAGASYAVWDVPAAHGVGLDVQGGIGLSPTWQLRAGVGYATHPHPAYALQTASLRAEVAYLIDIVELVPFAGLGASGLAVFMDERTEYEPALHLLGGVAYWLSFDWLLELDVRAHLMPGAEDGTIYLVSTLSVVCTFDR